MLLSILVLIFNQAPKGLAAFFENQVILRKLCHLKYSVTQDFTNPESKELRTKCRIFG